MELYNLGNQEKRMVQTVEILSYKLHPGASATFQINVERFSLPLHRNIGIDVVAFGQSLHDQESYILIRSFASVEQMDRLLNNFYDSRAWHNGPRDGIVACISDTHRIVCQMNNGAVKLLRGMKFRA